MSKTQKLQCTVCGKVIYRSTQGTRVPCCHDCRRTLTIEQKVLLGLCKPKRSQKFFPSKSTTCVACGQIMWKSRNNEKPGCCRSCRKTLTKQEKIELGVNQRPKKRTPPPWSERKPLPRICKGCNGTMMHKSPQRKLCDDCLAAWKERTYVKDPRRNQRNMAKKRARKAAAFVEDVDPTTLFERDGWRCYICGKKCRRDVNGFHPLAPTIEHIIPLSRGGEHSYKNTACAHRRCNVSKGAKDIGQQLAIVG